MKLLSHQGLDHVAGELQSRLVNGGGLDLATSGFCLHAFRELMKPLLGLRRVRMLLPAGDPESWEIQGGARDRSFRNQLQTRWLAAQALRWLRESVELRIAPSRLPQSLLLVRTESGEATWAATGSCPWTTSGLGLVPGDPFQLVQATEHASETAALEKWFDTCWAGLPSQTPVANPLVQALEPLVRPQDASTLYHAVLFHLFQSVGHELDEERVMKMATGIRTTAVWQKLFRFQRDGVVGAIDKLNRFGGCIIADSVGLGKTFEALAIIKYFELRNDRVLVLCPKRLRDNWMLYKANDRRNILDADRFHYDVLNHTDLSREDGHSGDIDLSHINWGNYDLVVIDESHNFRNKAVHRDRETRYDRLMRKIIQTGVRTRVLMLSATPVNNRLADLRNQIAFATEGRDGALADQGIPSIEGTVRQAQQQFNRWLNLDEADRTSARLMEMLGFDYFKLLDLLTIARSRKHIERYYGTAETGRFPERLKPINRRPGVDSAGEFRSIRDINNEIRRLNLAAYAPLRYVLPSRQAAYDARYSTQVRGGEGFFRQADREESLVHLLRVNVLKRMESAVGSFALTVQRQLADVQELLAKIEAHPESVEELNIADVDIEDPSFESLLVGCKVKVLLNDVDQIRWKQELIEDRNRLETLLSAARQVDASRDAKLAELKAVIRQKIEVPLNPGNRKVIVFTAFADTARYLFEQISSWAHQQLGIHTALVTGTGRNQSTLPALRQDLGSILSAFSPRSKERPPEFASDGELDLLIATDCISEGQNLQDCDFLINYDIHWNPVRIIQRFGRIDRIGSPNSRVQLVNFWPDMELEEYINLEQRVSGRMVLLDISATGEENIIEQQSGNPMNDLEYRRRQLLKLQDAVIDLEDLSSGVSIADLTLTDFRIDLAQYLREQPGRLEALPMGSFAVVTSPEVGIPPGVVFCLRSDAKEAAGSGGYPLAPHYLVHVGEDGSVLLAHPQVKRILDRLKRLCIGRDLPDAAAHAAFDRETRLGQDMTRMVRLLAAAVGSVCGKQEERAVESLFVPGGTHGLEGEFAGIQDFEVVCFVVIRAGTPT